MDKPLPDLLWYVSPVNLRSVFPALCLRLKAAVDEGRHAEALAIQQRLNPLARAVTTGFGIAGLKAAMDLCGLAGGAPRLPLAPVGADAIERIRTLLHETHLC